MSGTLRISIYEDNDNLRETLEWIIESAENCVLVGSHANPLLVLEEVEKEQPEVILMDIEMPFMNGIAAVNLLSQKAQKLPKVLLLTIYEDSENILASIKAGAVGYLLKNTSADKIIESISDINKGGAAMSPSIALKVLNTFQVVKNNDYQLSQREKEVLQRLVEGDSYKLIAAYFQISHSTVEKHIVHIYQKLHVNSKGEAISKAIRDNLV